MGKASNPRGNERGNQLPPFCHPPSGIDSSTLNRQKDRIDGMNDHDHGSLPRRGWLVLFNVSVQYKAIAI